MKEREFSPALACIINRHSKRGIVHVGANIGQERYCYRQCNRNVLWFEPDYTVFKQLVKNIEPYPEQVAINDLILDTVDEVRFNISAQSCRSSAFDFKGHFKESTFKDLGHTLMIPKRLDYFDLTGYDCLCVDAQGGDLSVIKSLGDKLSAFNLIKAEVFTTNMYKDAPMESDMNSYMKSKNFKLVQKFEMVHKSHDNIYVPYYNA